MEKAEKATVIVDAEDYFRISREAMKAAKHQIMLVGWDFDARIRLVREGEDDAPVTVGEFIDWLIERTPTLQIHLLRWDVGAMKNLFRGRTIFTLMRWAKHPRIHLRLDGHHPTGGSHHQKVVVIDDCIAFCGGIDITAGRWDTREHLDDDPERIGPDGEPYGPWHDVTTAMSGDV
ncbi:phospholipase, partial [Escherichia coli]|nr:phospholipase [Escherichia coli]